VKARYLHIYLKRNDDVTVDQVKEQMDLALDWYKYDPNIWIVYTNSEISKWKTRCKSLAGDSGEYFICEIDLSVHAGWMSKAFWDWLNKSR
jgi:hypothetical protein